jgi:hypothetical protein
MGFQIGSPATGRRGGPRTWSACEGSGAPPADIQRLGTGILGRCPICQRWVFLTRRTERLHTHRFVAPPGDTEKGG